MSNLFQPNGGLFPLQTSSNNGNIQLGNRWLSIATGRTGALVITAGRLAVLTGASDSSGRLIVEAAAAADTKSGASSTRKIVGVFAVLMDSNGIPLDTQAIIDSQAGLCQIWEDPNLTYGLMMNGVPASINTGSIGLALGTVLDFDAVAAGTLVPYPVAQDVGDSSSYSGTNGTNALNLMGAHANAIDRDTTAATYVQVQIASSFKATPSF